MDVYEIQGLTLNLLRLQRGPRLIAANRPRWVSYRLAEGGEETLFTPDQTYDIGSYAQDALYFPEPIPHEVRILQAVLSLLERERAPPE